MKRITITVTVGDDGQTTCELRAEGFPSELEISSLMGHALATANRGFRRVAESLPAHTPPSLLAEMKLAFLRSMQPPPETLDEVRIVYQEDQGG